MVVRQNVSQLRVALDNADEIIGQLARLLPAWTPHPPNDQCDRICEAHRSVEYWRQYRDSVEGQ